MNGCWNAGAKMAAGISAVRISCGASDNLIKIKLEIISILLGRGRGFTDNPIGCRIILEAQNEIL